MPSQGAVDVEAVQASARLLPEADSSKPTEIHRMGSASARQRSGAQALTSIVHSWASRKFAVGCAILFPVAWSSTAPTACACPRPRRPACSAILFPVAVTVYVTWWFLTFFDNFFSPIYYKLFDFHVFGLGFITSMSFIFLIGVFFSSWLGSALLGIGEWIIKRLPLVKHIYSASKQVSAAINPENEASKAFQECVIIRHPRKGEYAIAFITGRTVLQMGSQDTALNTVYVPTNHVYVGDIFLIEDKDVMHTNLSVREGLEIVVSCGMAIPPNLVTVPRP